MSDKKNNSIGALWARKSEGGTSYFTGVVEIDGEKTNVVVFKNKYKEPGDNQPNYRIYISEPLEGKKGNGKKQSQRRETNTPLPDDDDIPF